MAVADIAVSLNATIASVMGDNSGPEGQRIAAIERSIWRTFQALPKNDAGRLAPRAARYVAHNYFAKEHGWQLAGLEPESMQSTAAEVHSASIMQEKAPALVETMLEARQAGRGLSFEDVVVMISAVQRLIFQESLSLLRISYSLNRLNPVDEMSESHLHEVLRSYLLLFRQGNKANIESYEQHQEEKARHEAYAPSWQDLVEYEQDHIWNSAFSKRHVTNPFKPRMYSFEAASQIVDSLAHDYGQWQNGDCTAMKEHLISLDRKASGAVPLSEFYSPTETSAFQFHESVDYLRSIGALDETNKAMARVRIPNYVAGPTNCIAQSAYYSVCCLSECETLMNELEGKIQAPMASSAQLVRLLSNMESSSMEAPRVLPKVLVDKLDVIAERNDGAVPLHGRLFAQWLHFAFPYECPFPEQVSSAALTPSQWLDGKALASPEEIVSEKEKTSVVDVEMHHMAQWSDDELLPLHEDADSHRGQLGPIRSACGWLARLLPLVVLGRVAYSAWDSAVRAHSGRVSEESKKEIGHMI